jgi:hypothetical protein
MNRIRSPDENEKLIIRGVIYDEQKNYDHWVFYNHYAIYDIMQSKL